HRDLPPPDRLPAGRAVREAGCAQGRRCVRSSTASVCAPRTVGALVHCWGMPIDVSDLELPGLTGLPGYAEGRVPGGALHRLVEELGPATLATDHEVLDYVAAWRRCTSAAAACELAGVVEFVRRPEYVGPD